MLKKNQLLNLLLTVKSLKKTYYHHPVLNGVTFSVDKGETVAVMGKNGIGKSTLLRVLSRISSPDGGEVWLNGENLLKGRPALRGSLLYLGHYPALYPSLSAVENLVLALELRQNKREKNGVKSALKSVGLGPQMHDAIAIYSQGMLQRLKLAMANLLEWDLLLFDEPFTGLDAEGAARVDQFLNQCKHSGKSVMLVLHNLERALDHCSRFIFLSDGKVGADLKRNGHSPEEIRETFHTIVG